MPALSIVIALAGAALAGPPQPEPGSAAGPGLALAGAPAPASRADLAAAYLRLERTFFSQPLDDATIAEVNRQFDRATTLFFSGFSGEAVGLLRDITRRAESQPGPEPSRLIAEALRAEVHRDDAGAWPAIELQFMYRPRLPESVELPASIELGLAIARRGGEVRRAPAAVVVSTAERPEVNLTVDPASLVPPGAFGTFDLFVTDGTDMDHPIGFVVRAAESLDAARAENERRLNCISTPEVGDCVRICRARNALLTDLPGSENSAQFMLDLVVLAREVSREIDLLERGENPYRRRPGDHWRIITVGDGEVPARLYAPARACTDEPAPLIIALHGAGADENVFPDAYGMGVIKRLADEHGFLLVSPRVGYFSAAPLVLDSIIEAASRDYAVDAQRIYLLGHSMGGGIVTAWCRMRPNRIAAACTIAGIGGFPPGASIPPVLVIAAELDELVPAERVQRSAERAIDAGLPLAFRLIKGYGHTLVVGAVQPEVVPWLLEHRLAVPAPPESDAVPQP